MSSACLFSVYSLDTLGDSNHADQHKFSSSKYGEPLHMLRQAIYASEYILALLNTPLYQILMGLLENVYGPTQLVPPMILLR